MKVLGICGSPREGNTQQMLRWVLDSCVSGGVRTEMVLLRELDIKHCNSCNVCYGTGRPCTIHDDMEELIAKMLESDAIIIATPNYFTNVSGLMKDFFDRTNPLCIPPLLKDKTAAFLCVGAQPFDNWGDFLEQIFINYVKGMKMISAGSVIARAEDAGEITKNDDVKLSCINLGNNILSKLGH